MSATCEHPDDDAVLHADCAGCAQLMAQLTAHAEREHPTSTTRELGPTGPSAARRAVFGPEQTPAYGVPVYRAGHPTLCPRCRNELSIVRDDAGSEWRCNACAARYPIDVELAPCRSLAELRADLAELAGVLCVWGDLLEWRGTDIAGDARAAELVRLRDAIAARITSAVIAGRAPGDPQSELLALLDLAQPGSWYGDEGGDGRMLDQEQTDTLIRRELFAQSQRFARTHPATLGEVMEIIGHPRVVPLYTQSVEPTRSRDVTGDQDGTWMDATRQRGGIASDPLVRLLAFRTWGDRDQRWFEDRGVRKGEDCAVWTTSEGWAIAALRPWEQRGGVASRDARPGELVDAGFLSAPYRVRVSDRPRRAPARGIGREAHTTRARAR